MNSFWLVITWLTSIHTMSLALRHSIWSQLRKFLCAVLKKSSSLQKQHAEILTINNIVEIKRKSWGSQTRCWGENRDSFKVNYVIEYTEGGIWRRKREERSLFQQISVLNFLVTIWNWFNATWIVEHWAYYSSWPNYSSRETVSMLLIVYFQISYFLYLPNLNIPFPCSRYMLFNHALHFNIFLTGKFSWLNCLEYVESFVTTYDITSADDCNYREDWNLWEYGVSHTVRTKCEFKGFH